MGRVVRRREPPATSRGSWGQWETEDDSEREEEEAVGVVQRKATGCVLSTSFYK